jgi:ubiquinone/menaquinone biosynthesis C-methylase UbiE
MCQPENNDFSGVWPTAQDPAIEVSPGAPPMSLPPPWTDRGQHAVMPHGSHDDAARFNVLAAMNGFLASRIMPTVKQAYEHRGRQAFRLRTGRDVATMADVEVAIGQDPAYQAWSALRRNTMETRQQTGRELVLRQAEALAERTAALNAAGAATLQLDPALPVPDYVAEGDQHLMPGGYATELFPGDVGGPANYDAGIFATTGGRSGPWSDLAGRALVAWLRAAHPDFRPRRILDLGCGLGHNTLPLREAFPEAEIIAIDVAVPMLRYGHARARSLGVTDISFRQLDATRTGLPAGEFDLVFTTMVLHETSREAVEGMFAEAGRLLAPGGLTIHLEQPPYRQFGPFEQFMRDWDGRNNNEPFWSEMHQTSLPDLLVQAGFARADVFEAAAGVDDPGVEDFGRAPKWYTVGAWRR